MKVFVGRYLLVKVNIRPESLTAGLSGDGYHRADILSMEGGSTTYSGRTVH